MKFLYKLLKQDPDTREGVIATTSVLGIAVNILIAAAKVVVGLLASSISIISEGVNNASDALTSVLTLLGSKLANKHPDKKHPFGYGRIEYLTSLVISVLILVTGVEMLISSVKLIFNPSSDLDISWISLTIVAVSAVIKFFLGIYTIKMGKKSGSSALEAVGLECRNDSFVSVITIITALVFIIFHFSIDAYAGVLTSAIIIKAGAEVLLHTISELLGRPGEKDLALKIYKEVRSTEGVLAAADMMLHNYGPDRYSGSVNIEMDHEMTAGEIYKRIHELQLHIMHDYGVTMVFGIYAVDSDHDEAKELRKYIGSFVKNTEHVTSFHAVYIEPGTNDIYCDLVVDYNLKSWDELRSDFLSYMAKNYPENRIQLTIETEFV